MMHPVDLSTSLAAIVAPDIPAVGGDAMVDKHELATTINNASREAFSFSAAVREIHGEAQSRLALDDWLDILDEMPSPPETSARYWRSITLLAAGRLADRLCEEPGSDVSVRRTFDYGRRSQSQDQSPDQETISAHQV